MKYKTFRTILFGAMTAAAGGLATYFATRLAPPPPPPARVASVPAPPPVAPRPPPPVEIAPAPAAAPADVPPGGQALRDFDRDILALQARGIPGEKAKDALPSKRVKVNAFKDAGMAYVNRVKIDLDRDDKWDEKWTFEPSGGDVGVKRQVAPADDENYSVEYRLRGGAWVKKD